MQQHNQDQGKAREIVSVLLRRLCLWRWWSSGVQSPLLFHGCSSISLRLCLLDGRRPIQQYRQILYGVKTMVTWWWIWMYRVLTCTQDSGICRLPLNTVCWTSYWRHVWRCVEILEWMLRRKNEELIWLSFILFAGRCLSLCRNYFLWTSSARREFFVQCSELGDNLGIILTNKFSPGSRIDWLINASDLHVILNFYVHTYVHTMAYSTYMSSKLITLLSTTISLLPKLKVRYITHYSSHIEWTYVWHCKSLSRAFDVCIMLGQLCTPNFTQEITRWTCVDYVNLTRTCYIVKGIWSAGVVGSNGGFRAKASKI